MEPRPFDRGNNVAAAGNGSCQFTSMEPRPFDRGNSGPGTVILQSDTLQWSHGHSTVETSFRLWVPGRESILQWSHGHSTVETSFRLWVPGRESILQWSHGHSTVETPSALARLYRRYGYFNGATAIRPWKHVSGLPDYVKVDPTSMEPRPFDRGNPLLRKTCRWPNWHFNGATAIRPWKPGRA